jgi:DNA invertase Pin-like site-specific DNA recombinase
MRLGYARVSTSDQTLDLQLDALKAAGAERIFTDTASGAKASRPGLDQLLEHARPGDAIVIWKFDRLARSLRHLIDLCTTFEEKGIELISLTEKIDTTGPAGKLLFRIMASVAEFERDLIIERTNAGLKAARAKGKHIGRRCVLSREQFESARSLLDAKKTPGEIARSLHVSRRTIIRVAAGEYDRHFDAAKKKEI